ncbi:MAG: hypothetical protein IPP52_12010 [Ignavibacteria bacterium]|nr:hypothetical protein [Ignavibacteria bacterium]
MEILYDPLSTQQSIYKELAESDKPADIYSATDASVKPATDDKPFFDQNIGFGNLTVQGIKETFSQDDKAILALKDKPVAETTLIAIFIQCILAAGLFILLPLKLFRKEGKSSKAQGEYSADRKYLFYFACLGFGYIILQIGLVQKFTLFLGQPSITLLTVVSTMLVSSGAGSFFSGKIFGSGKKKLYLIFGIIAALILAIAFYIRISMNTL